MFERCSTILSRCFFFLVMLNFFLTPSIVAAQSSVLVKNNENKKIEKQLPDQAVEHKLNAADRSQKADAAQKGTEEEKEKSLSQANLPQVLGVTNKCSIVHEKTLEHIAKYTQLKNTQTERMASYNRSLETLVNQLDSLLIPSATLDAGKSELARLWAVYLQHLEAYLIYLDEAQLQSANCKESGEKYKSALQSSRRQLQAVRSSGQDIRVFLQSKLKMQLDASETEVSNYE